MALPESVEGVLLDKINAETAAKNMAWWDYWQAKRKQKRLGGKMHKYLRGYWNPKMGVPVGGAEIEEEKDKYTGKLRVRECAECGELVLSAEEEPTCKRCDMRKMFRVVKCSKCGSEVVCANNVRLPYICKECRK